MYLEGSERSLEGPRGSYKAGPWRPSGGCARTLWWAGTLVLPATHLLFSCTYS